MGEIHTFGGFSQKIFSFSPSKFFSESSSMRAAQNWAQSYWARRGRGYPRTQTSEFGGPCRGISYRGVGARGLDSLKGWPTEPLHRFTIAHSGCGGHFPARSAARGGATRTSPAHGGVRVDTTPHTTGRRATAHGGPPSGLSSAAGQWEMGSIFFPHPPTPFLSFPAPHSQVFLHSAQQLAQS